MIFEVQTVKFKKSSFTGANSGSFTFSAQSSPLSTLEFKFSSSGCIKYKMDTAGLLSLV